MNEIFNFYYDAGHGWLEVDKSLLEELDILDKISTCSYQKGGKIYLEEDCDATCFSVEFFKRFNRKHEEKSINHGRDSKIRGYERFYLQKEKA